MVAYLTNLFVRGFLLLIQMLFLSFSILLRNGHK